MKRRPTITDVAARAGVSKSTVSLVLQGSPLVRSETAKSVRAAMREIGYVYNRAAATLRGSLGWPRGSLSSTTCATRSSRNSRSPSQMAMAAAGYATVISNADEDAELQEKTGRLDDRARCRRGGDQPGLWRSFLGVRPIGAGRYSDPAGAAPDGPAHGAVFPSRASTYRRRQRRGHAAPDRQRRRGRIAFVGGLDETLDHAGADGGLPRRAGGGGPVAAPGRGSRPRAPSAEAPSAPIEGRPSGVRCRVLFQRSCCAGVDRWPAKGRCSPSVAISASVGFDDIEEAALAWP